jgi:hypothetical protein
LPGGDDPELQKCTIPCVAHCSFKKSSGYVLWRVCNKGLVFATCAWHVFVVGEGGEDLHWVVPSLSAMMQKNITLVCCEKMI